MQATPSTIELHDQPGHAIRRLHQIAVGIFLQETAELGLTPVQYAALQSVHNEPGIDQRTLASRIAQDTSTTAGVVERLQGRGWLQRAPDPADRRVRRLHLTDAGRAVLAAAQPAMQRAQVRILQPLTDAERAHFMALLQRVVQHNNVHSRAPAAPAGV
ncbi:MAG: MarR family transcriptional regulator [Tepidimonas ignava]|jgi:DNA-binding MarR family transcriptional regulator|uniref:HTH-type transcriptional repressor NicR n=1 Tax=Tepidimonas ignava TaxID=114249 RepID=A0A4R3LEA4_9BURK|nr:MarR family transcriptional regulator [Tepidimonas ignava]MCX7814820.1 MarR family transcriptional regulator [Tepidimonas ignava]TCS98309.1 MarR family transcriptional regulator [Tepidimonas ignava]TSE21818.1 HTH-type transcriptional repressor NicR [Tepidimonas ignava]